MNEKVLGFKEKDVWLYKKKDPNGKLILQQYRIDQYAKLVPVVSIEEYNKVKDNRNDLAKGIKLIQRNGLKAHTISFGNKQFIWVGWVKKYCKEQQSWRNNYINVSDLISAIRKQLQRVQK